jgi:hypothetical protein
MLDYTKYYPAMIAMTPRGYAFIYWCDRRLGAHLDHNYGRGKQHWFEYLGKKTKDECRVAYPHTPILQSDDSRINNFCRRMIREMEELVSDDL